MIRAVRLATAGLVAVLSMAGCASRTLDVRYPASAAHRALLASVTPRRVVVTAVTDRRLDKVRIGASPENAKPIVTARPVPDILHEALVIELGKNGHRVVGGPADIVLAADLEEFWLDSAGRGEATQYVGRVAIAVTIADAGSGARLFHARYVGVKRRVATADSRDVWREVMDAALARTVRDVATDPDFAATIGRVPDQRPGGPQREPVDEDVPAPYTVNSTGLVSGSRK
jgi:uncharacterized lipoprotein YajG